MSSRSEEGAERPDAVPEMRPWREVGWIFRDGHAFAVERQGDRTGVRAAPLSRGRDE